MPRLKWAAKDIPSKCIAIDDQRTQWTFDGVSGLVLDCLPNGERVWRYRYRVHVNGKRIERSYRLGRLDPEAARSLGGVDQDQVLSPGQARDKSLRVAVEAGGGGDPVAAGRAPKIARTIDTFGDLTRDWVERHGKPNKKSWPEDEKRYKRHIEQRIGDIPARELTRQQIIAARDEVATTVGPVEANHVHALISAALKWALNQGRIDTHPAYSLPKLKERHRERFIRPDELRAIWAKLKDLSRTSAEGIKLCILLGQRSAEVAGMAVSELSLDGPEPHWILPSHRTKNKLEHLVPLPPLAVALISRNVSKSAFIFPGHSRVVPPKAINREVFSKPFTAMVRALSFDDLVLHDARHTVKTALAEMGVPVNISDRVTNQVTGDRSRVGSRYEHYEYRAEKLRALVLWERRLLEIVEGRPASGQRW